MRPEPIYEALRFLTRDGLDLFQFVTRGFRQMIDSTNKLALRPVHVAYVGYDDMCMGVTGKDVKITLTGDEDEIVPEFKDQLSAETFETIHRRLNNCFIAIAFITFSEREFLEYWLPKTTSRVGSIEIRYAPGADNMDMVDLVVNHLRPTAFEAEVEAKTWNSDGSVHSSDLLALLNRDSFRATIQSCDMRVLQNAMPAPGFVMKDGKGFRNYCIRCHDDGAEEWIDRFIDSFVSEGSINEALESVELLWDVVDRHSDPKRLHVPSKTDVPIPRNDFLERRIPANFNASPCSMSSFRCKRMPQQLDVFAWTVDWNDDFCEIEVYLFLFKQQ